MDNQFAIQLFEQQQVRIVWDAEVEKYYFSIVDVVQILTDSADAAAYWRKLKQRLKAEGNDGKEFVIVCASIHCINNLSNEVCNTLP